MTKLTPLGPRKRRLRIVLIVMAVLTVVFTIGLFKLDSVLNHYKQQMLPKLAAILGRPVTLGHVSTSLLHGVGAKLEDAVIEADPDTKLEKDDVLRLDSARVSVKLLPFLFSGGKTLSIREIAIEGLKINVVRYPDGTLNVDRMADEIKKNTAQQEPKPPSETRVEDIRIEDMHLSRSRIQFVDLQSGGPPVAVNDIDLRLRDVSMKKAFEATLSAAVISAQRNLDLRVRFVPSDEGPMLSSFALKMAEMQLGPLAPLLAKAMPGLQAATASATFDATLGAAAPQGKGPTTLKGTIAVKGVRFAGASSAFDAGLDTDVTAEVPEGNATIRRFSLRLGKMGIDAQGALRALKSAPQFESFQVRSHDLDFDLLRSYYPALGKESGVELSGPFSIEATASGNKEAQSFDLSIDLTPAKIVVPKQLHKSAGTPLLARARGNAKGDSVSFETVKLEVADLAITGGGSIKNLKQPSFDLRLAGNTPTLTGLARLLPPVQAALPPKATVQGALALQAQLSGTEKQPRFSTEVSLSKANLRVPDARVVGGATLKLKGDREGTTSHADLAADLDGLEIQYLDLLHKRAGQPLSLHARMTGTPSRTTPTFDAQIGPLKARGDAVLQGKDQKDFTATILIPPFSSGELIAMLPSLAESKLPSLRMGADIRASGRMGAPETFIVDIKKLTLQSGKSDLSGELSLKNAVKPQIKLSARSKYLDLDELLPPPKKEKKKADLSMLKDVTGEASLEVARGRASGFDYSDLKTNLVLQNGRAKAQSMEVKAFGGTFSGSGTELDLVDDKGPFRVIGKLENMDVDQLLTRFAGTPNLLRGRLSVSTDLNGRGTTVDLLKQTLDGKLGGSLLNGELLTANFIEGIARPLAGKVPLIDKNLTSLKSNLKTTPFKQLQGALNIHDGAVATTAPLAADTPYGPLSLAGKVLLAGKLDMTGTITLPGAVASQLVANAVKIDRPIPVKLRVTGDLKAPQIVPTEIDGLAKIYLTAIAEQKVKGALQPSADKLQEELKKRGVPGNVQVPTSKGEAEAQVKAQADEARKKAEEAAAEEQRKLRERAEAEKRAAEEKARQEMEQRRKEAEEKAKGAIGDKLRGVLH